MAVSEVLFVCEGNICRSPMAEMLWTYRDSPVRAASAGLNAVVGAPIDPRAADALAAAGYPIQPFEARQFTPVLAQSPVIVTMSCRQRRAAVSMVPSAYPRAFTLLELATLAREFPSAPVRELHRQRKTIGDGGALDIPDPVRENGDFFLTTREVIEAGLEDIAPIPDFRS